MRRKTHLQNLDIKSLDAELLARDVLAVGAGAGPAQAIVRLSQALLGVEVGCPRWGRCWTLSWGIAQPSKALELLGLVEEILAGIPQPKSDEPGRQFALLMLNTLRVRASESGIRVGKRKKED